MQVEKLPDDVKLSPHIIGMSEGFVRVQFYGNDYYVPITKDLRKLLGIKIKNGLLVLSYKKEKLLQDYFRHFIDAIYLQLRDTIGAQVYEDLSEEIKKSFEDVFVKSLDNSIIQRLNQKMKVPELPLPKD